MNKRLVKELQTLIVQQNSKPLLENDYLIYFDDEDINIVYAIIKAPFDSVYRHKFIRLDLFIPKDYPFQPPTVTFVNFDGCRIHPTLYEDGRCCSTILNTWPSIEQDGVKKEAWSSSMGIETILLMFLSFLDYQPYSHEPGGKDDVTYAAYVLYQSWKTCLLRYLYTPQPALFYDFMNLYIVTNIETILTELEILTKYYTSCIYYTPCFYIGNYTIEYEKILDKIYVYYLNYLDSKNEEDYERSDTIDNNNERGDTIDNNNETNETNDNIFIDTIHIIDDRLHDNKCQICFDKLSELNNDDNKIQNTNVKLPCNHVFHNFCIKRHVLHNGKLCSICRVPIDINEWLINPLTNKKIKIDSLTFKKLTLSNEIN